MIDSYTDSKIMFNANLFHFYNVWIRGGAATLLYYNHKENVLLNQESWHLQNLSINQMSHVIVWYQVIPVPPRRQYQQSVLLTFNTPPRDFPVEPHFTFLWEIEGNVFPSAARFMF